MFYRFVVFSQEPILALNPAYQFLSSPAKLCSATSKHSSGMVQAAPCQHTLHLSRKVHPLASRLGNFYSFPNLPLLALIFQIHK